MRRSPNSHVGESPTDRLARVGAAATPGVEHVASAHLAAIERELVIMRTVAAADAPARSRDRLQQGRRPRAVAYAAVFAALVVMPSMALAGVLPDPVQRAASRFAANVGVHVPLPETAAETARPQVDDVTRGPKDVDSGKAKPAPDATVPEPSNGRGAATRGTTPGRPEPGEVRGNRYGQVPGGPDRGTATPGAKPATPASAPSTPPASSGRPSDPGGSKSSSPAASAAMSSAPAGTKGGAGNASGTSARD
ncbi:MAG: hypothetical protein JWM86_1158 [Thermoleophilia bacterium]|nr:hypothetical protein [Thermoleophilia bacterium]